MKLSSKYDLAIRLTINGVISGKYYCYNNFNIFKDFAQDNSYVVTISNQRIIYDNPYEAVQRFARSIWHKV